MAKLHFTQQAINDLSEIWNYTCDNWSEKQADKYYNLLIKACQEIANSPAKGKAYDEIGKGIRGYVANRHLIIFHLPSPGTVEIIRILHRQMELCGKFR
jgi:toxin ParE1/3/4